MGNRRNSSVGLSVGFSTNGGEDERSFARFAIESARLVGEGRNTVGIMELLWGLEAGAWSFILRMRRDGLHLAAGDFFLVVAPGHRRVAVADDGHRDAL